MEAADAADQIRDAVEEELAEERAERWALERFRTRAAIIIAILATLLAIASLGGENATKEAINANIMVTDTWAFYQAKNIRQTDNQLAADEFETLLLIHGPSLSEQARQAIQQRIDRYKATVARYDSEPDPQEPDNPIKGEGKKELSAKAQYWEKKRDRALAQDPNFDYATALIQISIVLASVAIVGTSPRIMALALSVGAVGTLLMLNGFFLLFDLPIG